MTQHSGVASPRRALAAMFAPWMGSLVRAVCGVVFLALPLHAHAAGVSVEPTLVTADRPFLRAPAVHELPASSEIVDLREAFPRFPQGFGEDWQALVHRPTGTPELAFGGSSPIAARPLPSEADAVDQAEFTLDVLADLLHTPSGEREVTAVRHGVGKWAVHYRQRLHGLRVVHASAVVLFGPSGNVAAFGSTFYNSGSALSQKSTAAPKLTSAEASEIAGRGLVPADLHEGARRDLTPAEIDGRGLGTAATRPSVDPAAPELVYFPTFVGETATLRLAHRLEVSSEEPFGIFETYVDAATGEILARENLVDAVNVLGSVQGDTEDVSHCDGSFSRPLPHLAVDVAGSTVLTDTDGNFAASVSGVLPLPLSAELKGAFVDVNRAPGTGPDPRLTMSVTSGAPVVFDWTDANSTVEERDLYYHVTKVHDFIYGIDPAFTALHYSMPAVIGYPPTHYMCPANAWFDGLGVNFCAAADGYASPARLGDVIAHEYGHAVTRNIYGLLDLPRTDVNEGNSDVLGFLVTGRSVLGRGYLIDNCILGGRNAINDLQYPEDLEGTPHHDGQIISGFVWDVWAGLRAALPRESADRTARELWHFARFLGRPHNQPAQVMWTFLVDDDDGNLLNGTPHFGAITAAASAHGFRSPGRSERAVDVVSIRHAPIPSTADGSLGFDVVARVSSREAAIDPASLSIDYRVNGGTFRTLGMSPSDRSDEYVGHIPAMREGAVVEYSLEAADVLGNFAKSPNQAPKLLHTFEVVAAMESFDAGGAGWHVRASDGARGEFQWVKPSEVRRSATGSEPTEDATAGAGGGCFVTGACLEAQCGEVGQPGADDVDDGEVTLTSPVYNGVMPNGEKLAEIRFALWFSTNTGGAPNEDEAVVEVSNDAGVTWTEVRHFRETLPQAWAGAAWTTQSIDLARFFAEPQAVSWRLRVADYGAPSIVEAAVDDVRLIPRATEPASVSPSVAEGAPLEFRLLQTRPNPVRSTTRIEYEIPQPGPGSLKVYDVAGREVANLAEGVFESGRGSVTWNARDAAGRRVSPGLYFMRLSWNGEAVTRKTLVLESGKP